MIKDDSDRLSVVRDALRRRLGADRFDLWLGGRTRLELAGNTLRVVCASRAELSFLRRKLHPPLAECCVAVCSPAPSIAFVEATLAERDALAPPCTAMSGPMRSVAAIAVPPSPPAVNGKREAESRAPQRTFEDFCVGKSNELAARTSRELAEHPGTFSPLLLHGPSGCGKTHLLAAIEHAARSARGRLRVVSMTAEQFTSEFLEALNRRALPGFRHKMRSVDLLLIDDVQFLANKRATLEELLYTIDSLQGRQGQVVLTSNCGPAELAAINPDLASRLAQGLDARIDPPDYAVRQGTIREIARRARVTLCDAVVEVVAREVVGSARLLAGAVNRLVAASMAQGKPINLELAEPAIADYCLHHTPAVRLPDIQQAVCEMFGVEPATLRSSRRTRAVAEPRMLCMWLARRYTRAALSEIGEFFGGRTHSTVVSAKRRFDDLISQGAEIVIGNRSCQVDEAIRRIEARLRTG